MNDRSPVHSVAHSEPQRSVQGTVSRQPLDGEHAAAQLTYGTEGFAMVCRCSWTTTPRETGEDALALLLEHHWRLRRSEGA